MNDFELFQARNEAEKKFNELEKQFRERGLHKKPYCEYSHYDPDIPNIPGLKEFCEFVEANKEAALKAVGDE